GQDVQAGLELHLDGVDHGQVTNFEKAEHEKRENSNPNIGLTAILGVCYCEHHRAVPAAHCYVAEARLRTLGWVSLALLLQVQGDAAPESSTSIVQLLARSSAATKIVLLFLALFSIV